MHPILTEARARDHQRELLRQAEQWRRTHPHPREATEPTSPVISGLRVLLDRSRISFRRRPAAVPDDLRPAPLAKKEARNDGRSLSRV